MPVSRSSPVPQERTGALPARPALNEALRHSFYWLGGIDNTFIHSPAPTTGRTLDQYELTEHYQRWQSDIELIAGLGLDAVRYGLPWHRLNPRREHWEWSWADDVMDGFAHHGMEVIMDMVHYGTPPWWKASFLEPSFPQQLVDFTLRLLDRYPRIRWWTPFNEPRIAAWYSGRLGWWPPNRFGLHGYVAVLLAICRAIASTLHAVRHHRPDAVSLHVDPADLYTTRVPMLRGDARRRQALVFLPLDLIAGRVDDAHPLHAWLLAHGADVATLAWFREHQTFPDVIGINLYPMFSSKELVTIGGRTRLRCRYADNTLVERLATLYWRRYGRPVMITETAARGSMARREHWLTTATAAVTRLRARAVPVVGFTWWPLFGLVAWAYRQGHRELAHYIEQMGLWNLRWDAQRGMCREVTQLVDLYRRLANSGESIVGPLLRSPG
jgi:beta-glucosidase